MAIFSIQLSAPRTLNASVRDADSLADVLQEIFAHECEDAYLNWNGVRIALNYKYDVSVIIGDVVLMLDSLTERPCGECVIEWPSSSFRASWHVRWSDGRLAISADWIRVTGGIEAALRSVPRLEISIDEFIAEWAELVRLLALRLACLELPGQLDGYAGFSKVARAMSGVSRGLLYRETVPSSG